MSIGSRVSAIDEIAAERARLGYSPVRKAADFIEWYFRAHIQSSEFLKNSKVEMKFEDHQFALHRSDGPKLSTVMLKIGEGGDLILQEYYGRMDATGIGGPTKVLGKAGHDDEKLVRQVAEGIVDWFSKLERVEKAD